MALQRYEDNILNKLNKKITNVYRTYGETSEMYQTLAKSAMLNLAKYDIITDNGKGMKIRRIEPKGVKNPNEFINALITTVVEFNKVNVAKERGRLVKSARERREYEGKPTEGHITIKELQREARDELDLGGKVNSALQYLYGERMWVDHVRDTGDMTSNDSYGHYFDALEEEANDILHSSKKTYSELMRVVELVEESKSRKLNLLGETVDTQTGLTLYNDSIDYLATSITAKMKTIQRLQKRYKKQ